MLTHAQRRNRAATFDRFCEEQLHRVRAKIGRAMQRIRETRDVEPQVDAFESRGIKGRVGGKGSGLPE